MARLLTLGFELNSNSNFQEFDSTSGSPTIQTTTVRSGAYAGQITSLTSATQKGWRVAWTGSAANGPFFVRAFFRYATLPTAENAILSIVDQAGFDTSPRVNLTIDSGGALRLYEQTIGAIGSASSALSANTWYRLEIKVDRSLGAGSQTIEARIDGSAFATSSAVTYGAGFMGLNIGGNLKGEAQTTGNWYFDDMAVNDSTGSFQNTWANDGKIIELRPNAAGDVNTFSVGAGGTAGTANNYTRSAETSPDGNTTYNVATALNDEDLFNVVNSGIGASDTVNVVHVNGQLANNTGADATTALKFEIEKAAAGTITQSAAIIPNSTTYGVPKNASPRTYPITLYQDPDSASWTQTTLDSMQIGYKETALGTNHIRVSQVYALVDYTPVSIVNATVTQSVATVTATTGTQVVTSSQLAAVAQVAAVLTATGGTQAVTTGSVVSASITQVAATVTATGGTQAVATTSLVSITQLAATITATGNTQTVATVNNVALTQTGATVTATGGTQSIGTVNNSLVTQVATNLTATGGGQTLTAQIAAAIAQQAANLTATTGAQTVSASSGLANASVTQLGATLTVTGRVPVITTSTGPLPPARNYYIDSDGNIYWVINQPLGILEPV